MLCAGPLFSQKDEAAYSHALSARIDSAVMCQYRRAEPYFKEAYSLYPSVPRGMLEAVSFAYTRFTHLSPADNNEEDGGVPATYGLMGLTLDGKGFFRNNLRYVAESSGFPVSEIVASPRTSVLAYAAAYAALQQQLGIRSNCFDDQIPILAALSELPVSGDSVLSFALNSSLYAIAWFADNGAFRAAVGAAVEKPDFGRCFGAMLPRLQSVQVRLPAGEESSRKASSTDFEEAVWTPAGVCNYSTGRGGHAVSAVTIHYTQGTYASTIAWFQNCTYNGVGARASAHYVVRSFDGQVTQMVREADKAWHVGSCNPYTVGIEHEAYGDIASFFTPEMYQSSARLVRDICERNGISPHRMFYRDTLDDGTVLNRGTHSLGGESACVKIRGHQHFPNQTHTDPGPYWNWNYYYKLVNEGDPVTRFDALSGTLTDSGGPSGDYGNDERQLLLVQADGAHSITLSFSEFDLEDNYDFLWIYDGSTVFSPLLGRWNTTSPGTVTSSGDALLLEFRSDCATTAAGWVARWQAEMPESNPQPVTRILMGEGRWVTEDFSVSFEDMDDGAVPFRFYQVAGYDGQQWTANASCGFAYEDFDRLDSRLWSVESGGWRCAGGRLQQTGSAFSAIKLPLMMDEGSSYLYEFDMAVSDGSHVSQRAAGVRIGSSSASERGIACFVVVCPDENQIRLCLHSHDNRAPLLTVDGVITQPDVSYHYQIIHFFQLGKMMLFRDGRFLGEAVVSEDVISRMAPQGSGFAFFTSCTNASFDNLRIYRSRGASVEVKVGSGEECAMRWQSFDRSPAAKICSRVADNQWAFSDVVQKSVRVDYTEPILAGAVVRDERTSSLRNGAVQFRWGQAEDPHSGISYYEYGVASSPCAAEDDVRWYGVTRGRSIEFNPSNRLPANYCFVVRAVNGAGLYSALALSEKCHHGTAVRVMERSACTEVGAEWSVSLSEGIRLWPNPVAGVLHVGVPAEPAWVEIFDASGRRVCRIPVPAKASAGAAEAASASSGQGGETFQLQVDVSSLKAGFYIIRAVDRNGKVYGAPFVKQP